MSQGPTPDAASVDAPHVIRLRRPWLREVVAASDSNRIAYTRRFGAPGNLATDDCVELVAAGMDRLDAVWLNGKQLAVAASADSVRVDITRQLVARNELMLVIRSQLRDTQDGPSPATERWQDDGAVRLEIRQRK